MTIVINVQAIRHCHWGTCTAALKDLAISINVLCPSFTTTSFPLNNLSVMRYCVSFTYSWSDSQCCLLVSWDNGTFRLPFPSLWYCGSTEHMFSLCSFKKIFWWATFKMVFFSDVRKNKLQCRLPHSRGSFSLSWIMATITEDMGLGCAYFIKLKVTAACKISSLNRS